MTNYAFEDGKRSSTAISWSFATQTLASDAATPFTSFVDAAYQSTVAAAFARWASVSGLVFTQVNDGPSVAIRIGFGSFSYINELGETELHDAHGVFPDDTLIRLLDPAVSALTTGAKFGPIYAQFAVTLYQVALHEIGHALGLAHTTNPYTIMYPYLWPLNADLAAGDIQGINTLYPYFTVVALNPVQTEGSAGRTRTFDFVITRYSDPAVALTLNYSVTGAAQSTLRGSVAAVASEFVGGSYPQGQVSFAAGSTTTKLSIAVAGNAAGQPDQGFNIGLSTGNASDSVTVRGTLSALVLDDDGFGQINGRSLGIYRFFDLRDGTHFYSASQAERNTVIQTRPDLRYEGIGLTALASPSTDPAAAAVFRFFDTRTGTHFYSASTVERNGILATRPDLTFEGTAFYEHVTAQAGDVAVYRFFGTVDGTHFYTASTTERASILSSRADLRDEGIAFCAPAA